MYVLSCVLVSGVTFVNSVVLSIVVVYYVRSVLLVLLFGLFICLALGWVYLVVCGLNWLYWLLLVLVSCLSLVVIDCLICFVAGRLLVWVCLLVGGVGVCGYYWRLAGGWLLLILGTFVICVLIALLFGFMCV